MIEQYIPSLIRSYHKQETVKCKHRTRERMFLRKKYHQKVNAKSVYYLWKYLDANREST